MSTVTNNPADLGTVSAERKATGTEGSTSQKHGGELQAIGRLLGVTTYCVLQYCTLGTLNSPYQVSG